MFSKRFLVVSTVCVLCASFNAMAVLYAKSLPRVMVFKTGSSPRPGRCLDQGRNMARVELQQRRVRRRRAKPMS